MGILAEAFETPVLFNERFSTYGASRSVPYLVENGFGHLLMG
jgi:hypothetical protein